MFVILHQRRHNQVITAAVMRKKNMSSKFKIVLYSTNKNNRVGRPDATKLQDIVLSGLMIMNEHCVLENKSNEVVELRPCSSEAMCYVNGKRIEDTITLKSGDRVIFGKSHVFRYINPEQVRKEKSSTGGLAVSNTTSNCNGKKKNIHKYLI